MRTVLFLTLLATACGGAQTAPEEQAGECPSIDEACMDEAALASCEARAAECPGQVGMAESCPAQFFCPGESPAGGSGSVGTDGVTTCVDGETRAEDCNTCTCDGGEWGCTEMACEEA